MIDKHLSEEEKKEINSLHKTKFLRRLGLFFSTLFFLIGIYLLVTPFLPELSYQINKDVIYVPYITEKENILKESSDKKVVLTNKEIPKDNRIVIPSIAVDMPIVEGQDENALNSGIWRIPDSGVPGYSNMVLTGHRLGYGLLPEEIRSKTSFYNLDKVKVGDIVIIYWKGKDYYYKISGGEIVLPTQIEIENPTKEHQLTLYTCNPIGKRDQRLVKYAKPI